MKDYRSILYIIGILLCIESLAMLIPMIIDLIYSNNDWQVFFFSSFITFIIGLVLCISFRNTKNKIKLKEAFLLTVFSWIIIAAFASLPLMYASSNLSFSDAYFESISGITTTGATLITNLDQMSEGILIWRALLQWFGGIGIVVLAIAILPTLQIGGMQLLHMEHDDPYEKTLPKITQFIFEIFIIYLCLTIICGILYFLVGMSSFDAIAHSLTTICTGGFSTHNESFKFFNSIEIESVSILFMIIGSLPFVIFLKVVHGDYKSFFRDEQIQLFIFIVLILIIFTSLWLIMNYNYKPILALRMSSFNMVSILTGTGYTSSNFNSWGGFGLITLFIIMFIGGCAGSTTGGIKIFRLQLLFKGARIQIRKLSKPHGVFVTTFNKKTVAEETFNSIMGFFFIYILIFILSSILLGFLGLDFLTALSGAASAISNVGPGLGEIIGPDGNYSSISTSAKWILCFTMLIGRLELFTFLILLTRSFWKK